MITVIKIQLGKTLITPFDICMTFFCLELNACSMLATKNTFGKICVDFYMNA